MRKGKRYFSLILAGLLAVSLLAGCGGQEKKDKNTLTVAIAADPPTLDLMRRRSILRSII